MRCFLLTLKIIFKNVILLKLSYWSTFAKKTALTNNLKLLVVYSNADLFLVNTSMGCWKLRFTAPFHLVSEGTALIRDVHFPDRGERAVTQTCDGSESFPLDVVHFASNHNFMGQCKSPGQT